MVGQEIALEQFSLTELEVRCRQETQRFRQQQISDTRYCLEIVQRALRLVPNAPTPTFADNEARELLISIYTSHIEANINRQAQRVVSPEDVVQQVWLRFWSAASRGLHFASLEEALSYLKRATITTLIEEQRQQRRRYRDESLQQHLELVGEGATVDLSIDLFADHVRQKFRERCRLLIPDALEYRIFVLRYGVGMPPREIARELAAEGIKLREREPTPRLVSDVLERVFQRLRQDPDIHDLIRDD
jgi:DNA-directed RNA polymerase specialized sigma24 family protein